jgi:NADH:ubiquinone oxidoreductase subunit 6 (subunit J)
MLIVIILQTVLIFFLNQIMHIILNFLLIYIESSIIFLLCKVEFLAYMFLIIYAGAIVILFIFILMLVNFKFNTNINYKNLIIELILYILYIILVFYIIFYYNIDFDILKNNLNYLDKLSVLQYYYNIYNYNNLLQYIEHSDLTKLGIYIYTDNFIETLLVGLILLLSLIYIIYYLKK